MAETTHKLTVEVDEEIFRKIEEMRTRRGIARNALLKEFVKYALTNIRIDTPPPLPQEKAMADTTSIKEEVITKRKPPICRYAHVHEADEVEWYERFSKWVCTTCGKEAKYEAS